MDAICVYCGSSRGGDGVYTDTARRLGELIATRAGTLVFGGNCLGLMDTVAQSVQAYGGRVVGITPRRMHEGGTSYTAADELVITDDMRSRKAAMEQRADAFIALPGGLGTLEEITEILTGRVLGYHDKPLVLVNTAGFYDPLVELVEHMIAHGFAREKHRAACHVAADPDAAMDYLFNGPR